MTRLLGTSRRRWAQFFKPDFSVPPSILSLFLFVRRLSRNGTQGRQPRKCPKSDFSFSGFRGGVLFVFGSKNRLCSVAFDREVPVVFSRKPFVPVPKCSASSFSSVPHVFFNHQVTPQSSPSCVEP